MRNMMKDLGWEVVPEGKKTVDIEDSNIFDMVSSLAAEDKTLKEQRELLLMGGFIWR